MAYAAWCLAKGGSGWTSPRFPERSKIYWANNGISDMWVKIPKNWSGFPQVRCCRDCSLWVLRSSCCSLGLANIYILLGSRSITNQLNTTSKAMLAFQWAWINIIWKIRWFLKNTIKCLWFSRSPSPSCQINSSLGTIASEKEPWTTLFALIIAWLWSTSGESRGSLQACRWRRR